MQEGCRLSERADQPFWLGQVVRVKPAETLRCCPANSVVLVVEESRQLRNALRRDVGMAAVPGVDLCRCAAHGGVASRDARSIVHRGLPRWSVVERGQAHLASSSPAGSCLVRFKHPKEDRADGLVRPVDGVVEVFLNVLGAEDGRCVLAQDVEEFKRVRLVMAQDREQRESGNCSDRERGIAHNRVHRTAEEFHERSISGQERRDGCGGFAPDRIDGRTYSAVE